MSSRFEIVDMTDRQILLELLAGQREQNGAIAALKADMWGDQTRDVRGIKPQVTAHELAIDRFRTTLRTVGWLAGFFGLGNLALWAKILAG